MTRGREGGKEEEGGRGRERHTHTHTDRQTETDRQTDRQRERERERQTDTHTHSHTDRQTETDRERETHTQTQINRQTDRQSERFWIEMRGCACVHKTESQYKIFLVMPLHTNGHLLCTLVWKTCHVKLVSSMSNILTLTNYNTNKLVITCNRYSQ